MGGLSIRQLLLKQREVWTKLLGVRDDQARWSLLESHKGRTAYAHERSTEA